MTKKVTASKQFGLQWRDVLRGFLIAALTAGLVALQQSLEAGEITLNWQSIGMAALAGGVGYLLKNWLIEPPKVIITTNSNQKAEQIKRENQ